MEFRIVSDRVQAQEPPRHLRAPTRRWFRSVAKEFALEAHHVRLLRLACETFDRGERAREVLSRRGLTYLDARRNPRPRPENAIVRDCSIVFARLLRELRLDLGPPDDAERPPRISENGNGHRKRA
jgi:phage terminase small subunit